MTSAIEQFKVWKTNRHQYAKEWKERNGGKIVGYLCTYVPEEILYAAGILPVRVLGSHEPQDVTEPHIFGMFCPFCRDVLAQGLKGRFDYLDGITIAQSCLHIRQSFTSWKRHIPLDWAYYLPMPHHVQSDHSRNYLYEELKLYKRSVEEWTGKAITDEALRNAIQIYDASRHLMRQVYELRRADNPPMTGLEAMYMSLACQMVDKAELIPVLQLALEELSERQLPRKAGTRLMIIGSEDDDTEFIEMVESVGAMVVIDEHCTGTRYFWNESVGDDDPLVQIANRYIDRVPCPTKDWPQRRRLAHALRLAEDYNVNGAIIIQQKFCDPHECDIPPFIAEFKKNDIPTLFLEFDVTVPYGQFRTRVEAMLETINEEDLF